MIDLWKEKKKIREIIGGQTKIPHFPRISYLEC